MMQREDAALQRDVAPLVGGRASTASADRVAYARDLWPRQQIVVRSGVAAPSPPGVIVWPETAAEIAEVIRYAGPRGIPVVPFGAGSGVCGGVRPSPNAILLDVKRMRRFLRVDGDRLVAEIEAGIIGQQLEDGLEARGFTMGHFPSSIYCSTLGGWIAGRSAGQCSGRYGKIEDMVLSLSCVDGRGELLEAERGDALLPLMIGSEGILGVVTKATVRIAPAPATRRFASFTFPTTAAGLDFIRHVYQAGLRPAVCRLYDPFDTLVAKRGRVRKGHARDEKEREPEPGGYRPGLGARVLMRALRSPGALNRLVHALPDESLGGAMLILVWESHPELADAELAEARRLADAERGRYMGEEPARRWLRGRHSVSYRQSPLFASGGFVDTMEVASTWSRLLPMYDAVRRALSPHVFVMAHFSHAYPDGASIYFTFAGSSKDDAAALLAYDAAWRSALAAVIEAGGTLSHHHGVGRSKAPFMRAEQGAAIDVVRELSRELDPHGILNPGALIPDDGGAGAA